MDKARSTEVWDPDVKPDLNDSSHVFRGEHTLLVKQVYNLIFTILVPKCISYICYKCFLVFYLGRSRTRSTRW